MGGCWTRACLACTLRRFLFGNFIDLELAVAVGISSFAFVLKFLVVFGLRYSCWSERRRSWLLLYKGPSMHSIKHWIQLQGSVRTLVD